MKAKNSIDQHREKIAIKTLKMPDAMAKVMSMGKGQSFTDKEDAKDFLKSIGYTDSQIKKMSESRIKLKDLVESIDIAKKYAKGDEELIASNESYWQWEYDTSINHAHIFMKANGDLRLSISNEHIKSGIGKGEFYKELESENVGTVRKPDIARVKNLVKKHGHSKTRAGGPFKSQWFDVLNSKTDLLTNIIKQYKLTNEGSVAWNKQPSFVDEYSTKSVNRNNLKKFLDYLSGNDINHYFDGSQETLEFDSNELSRKGQELIKKIGLKEL